jgi:hypothetical protein
MQGDITKGLNLRFYRISNDQNMNKILNYVGRNYTIFQFCHEVGIAQPNPDPVDQLQIEIILQQREIE